jgi:serine/arginine repetitive matrix protein 2
MDGSSSPDPLHDSPIYQSPAKTRRSSRVTVTKTMPLRGSSPKKQTFQLDLGNELSPQKIKVTVEAEDPDEDINYMSQTYGRSSSPTDAPTTRRKERTTTTTVPVKGLSDTETNNNTQYAVTPKRGRGRPRKSVGTPVPTTKRPSTPNKRRSIGDLVDGDDEEDIDFRINQPADNSRSKGKSRSRSAKGTSRKSRAKDQVDVSESNPPKKRGRPRKSLLPEEDAALEGSSHKGRHRNQDRSILESEPASSNTASPPSDISTIRTTTTMGGGEIEPDVLLARFEPGNETPRQVGWSSPHIIETGRPASSRQRADSYPSSIPSPEKTAFSDEDENYGNEDIQYMEEEEEEEDDEVGELREFDTILDSEGFSMISVDSVLSLREQLNSPTPQSENGSSKSARHRDLLPVQEKEDNHHSFASIPNNLLEGASPVCKHQNPILLSVQNLHVNDSFSSIPPDVLEAATPARPQQKNRLLKTKEPNEEYEDSFSAIPPAILDAATPAAVRKVNKNSDKLSVPGTSLSSSRKDISPRLLTPEETPSPPEHEVEDSSANRKGLPPSTTKPVIGKSPVQDAQITSSPPMAAPRRYTYTAHIRNHRQLNLETTQTPSIIFSSPSLPPPLHPAGEQNALRPALDPSQRPMLSPIARTGRVLQDIMVPSSPRSRSQSLGSPFKSPSTDRRSSSVIPPAELVPVQDRLAGPLPRLDLSSHFSDRSSPQQHSTLQEDPFQNSIASEEQSPSPEQNQPYKLELPHQRHHSDPRLMNIRSEADSIRSDDAMSWQADGPPNLYEQPRSIGDSANKSSDRRYPLERDSDVAKTFALTNEQRWAAEREETRKQISSADANKVIVIDSDEDAPHDAQVEEEEDFGLLLDTLNSSSPAVERRQEPSRELLEKPRRSKLPSPWRQNSKRLVYSDEMSHSSPLSLQTGEKFDWPKKCNDTNPQSVAIHRASVEEANDSSVDDLSTWQIPQKSNFTPNVREPGHLDLSALLSASPAKQLPILPQSSQPLPSQGNSTPRKTLSDILKARADSSGSDKPGNTGFTPIPQKMGFNPRSRADRSSSPVKEPTLLPDASIVQPNQPISYPTLNSSPPRTTKLFGSSSPSRANTLLANQKTLISNQSPTANSPGSILSSQVSPDEKENRFIDSRTIEWTKSLRISTAVASNTIPPLQPPSSPVKSCLRSPLKTPSAATGPGFNFPNSSPSKAVAFVSSSPMPSSPPEAPLSSTTWSKSHWALLDSILATWKPDLDSPSLEQKRRRNSTRVISRLLGKTVRSQGESMVFEQWHLEAVDEFRGVVPGWEEKVIAMRLFSLILAADRRARGVSSQRCY